jgi:ubiquinone biosynthesis protein UbiJ
MSQPDSSSPSASSSDNSGSKFLTPLPRLLANAMQRSLRVVQSRNDALGPPPQQPFAVQLQGMGLTLRFASDAEQHIEVIAQPGTAAKAGAQTQHASTSIAATPVTLVMQTLGNPAGRSINIHGDATLAQAWQMWLRDLFSLPLQDPERHLSERFGAVIGVQMHRVLAGLRDWAGASGQHGAATLREYLQEESGLLVTAAEMEQFLDQVDELSERIERLQARLR